MARAIKVLFMTASATMRGLYSRQLAGAGFELAFIDSIMTAFNRAATTRPDFLVADLDNTARETLQSCRGFIEKNPDVHLILLCPIGEADRVKKATGAIATLAKPVNPNRVTEAVDNVLINCIEMTLAQMAREEEATRSSTEPETGLETMDHFDQTFTILARSNGSTNRIGFITGQIDGLEEIVEAHGEAERRKILRRFAAAVRKTILLSGAKAAASATHDGSFMIVMGDNDPAAMWARLKALSAAIAEAAEPRSLAALLRDKNPPAAAEPVFTISAVLKSALPGSATEALPEQTGQAFAIAVGAGARDKLFWLDETVS
jgi:PleD family two-component response regulator